MALDIGGVCLRLTPWRAYAALGIRVGAPVPPVLRTLIDHYSSGRIDSNAFCDGLQDFTGHRYTDAQLKAGWNSMLGSENPDMTRILRRFFEAHWHIVFFSDTQPWHIEGLRQILSYSDQIPEAIYSSDVGAEKPSPAMYEVFERQFGKPDLYLDDRLNNIEGGLARGWNAVQYIDDGNPDAFLKHLAL